MNKTNHFITAEQLAEVTGMDQKVAYKRLWYLTYQKVIRGYYDSSGVQKGVFQLPENVPLEAIPTMDVNQMSDKEVVKTILRYARDYQVTIAELVVIFNIDIYEAKEVLKRLRKSKLVSRLRKGMKHIYVIDRSIQQQRNFSNYTDRKDLLKDKLEDVKRMVIPTPTEIGRIKIPDADVIQLAIEHDGRLTPTLLCLKSKISIEEAKQKLEELYEQGTFVMDVDESNYVMEYQLRDKSLLDA
ncbi:MAG: hypothetical protein ACRBFS_16905 [Aureispira sp.]